MNCLVCNDNYDKNVPVLKCGDYICPPCYCDLKICKNECLCGKKLIRSGRRFNKKLI